MQLPGIAYLGKKSAKSATTGRPVYMKLGAESSPCMLAIHSTYGNQVSN